MHRQTFDGINNSSKKRKFMFPPHTLWQLDAWLGKLMVKEPGGYALSAHLARVDLKALLSGLQGEGIPEFMHNRLRMLSNQLIRSTTQNDQSNSPDP
jgi:hypothetical protein